MQLITHNIKLLVIKVAYNFAFSRLIRSSLHLYPGLVTGRPLPQLGVLLLQAVDVSLQLLAELQPAVRHLPQHGALAA